MPKIHRMVTEAAAAGANCWASLCLLLIAAVLFGLIAGHAASKFRCVDRPPPSPGKPPVWPH